MSRAHAEPACLYHRCRRNPQPGSRFCEIHQKAWDKTAMGRLGYKPLDIRKARPAPPRAGRNR